MLFYGHHSRVGNAQDPGETRPGSGTERTPEGFSSEGAPPRPTGPAHENLLGLYRETASSNETDAGGGNLSETCDAPSELNPSALFVAQTQTSPAPQKAGFLLLLIRSAISAKNAKPAAGMNKMAKGRPGRQWHRKRVANGHYENGGLGTLLPRLRALGFKKYSEYLSSAHWQNLRSELMILRSAQCEICLATGVRISLHHRTYERLGSERHEDIILVCPECHDRIHASERMGGKGGLEGALKRVRRHILKKQGRMEELRIDRIASKLAARRSKDECVAKGRETA